VQALASVDGAAVEAAARDMLAGPRGALGPGVWVVTGDRERIEPALEDAGLVPDVLWSSRFVTGGP